MAKKYFKISCDTMSLEDYRELWLAIVHMSCDIESNVPYPWDDENSIPVYSYVKGMLNCINDVPKSRVEYAESQNLQFPTDEL